MTREEIKKAYLANYEKAIMNTIRAIDNPEIKALLSHPTLQVGEQLATVLEKAAAKQAEMIAGFDYKMFDEYKALGREEYIKLVSEMTTESMKRQTPVTEGISFFSAVQFEDEMPHTSSERQRERQIENEFIVSFARLASSTLMNVYEEEPLRESLKNLADNVMHRVLWEAGSSPREVLFYKYMKEVRARIEIDRMFEKFMNRSPAS